MTVPNKKNNNGYQANRKAKNGNSFLRDTGNKMRNVANSSENPATNHSSGDKVGTVAGKFGDKKSGINPAALEAAKNKFVKNNPNLAKREILNNNDNNQYTRSGIRNSNNFLPNPIHGISNLLGDRSSTAVNRSANKKNGIASTALEAAKNKFMNGGSDLGNSNDIDDSGENDQIYNSPFNISSTLKMFIAKNPVVFFATCITAVVFLLIVLAFMTCVMSSASDGSGEPGEKSDSSGSSSETEACSMISIHSTSLTKGQFSEKLKAKANSSGIMGYKTFAANADTIYDISVKNNINPEMVVIRAAVEGFSPGSSKNNYWGMGCTNTGGYAACISYKSFSDGVLGYIKNISQYDSVEAMMSRYAYIGAYWYSPGSSSSGGCYYYPYVKKYMSSSRSEVVKNACSRSCSGGSCLKTNAEDSKAYTLYQVETMTNQRSNIFGIGADKCESSEKDTSGGDIGQKVVDYAIKTFDSFSYSQANRMGPSSVDCSSLVSRTYSHFNINITGVAAEEYRWCENKGKTISENNLRPGDLIFFSGGYHYNSGRYKGIGHVAIYAGNNKQFAAHSSRLPQPDQVSVSSYTKGQGSYFCRPYK